MIWKAGDADGLYFESKIRNDLKRCPGQLCVIKSEGEADGPYSESDDPK